MPVKQGHCETSKWLVWQCLCPPNPHAHMESVPCARRSLSTLASIVLVGMGIAVVPVLTIFLFNDDNSLAHDDEPLVQPLTAQKDPGGRMQL